MDDKINQKWLLKGRVGMKTLNQRIDSYTDLVRQGEVRAAYKGIMDFMGQLRAAFAANDSEVLVGGSLYQGYLDITYFSLTTDLLKEKGLKVAVVYLHDKKAFEAWLSARNRTILAQYRPIFDDMILDESEVFHDETNEDAVLECLLTDSPDFDRPDELMAELIGGTEMFITAVQKIIAKVPLD
jgi:hypothetical protein